MNELEAKEILRGMSFWDCMKMWNDSAKDNRMIDYIINDIDNDTWWEYLAVRAGGFRLISDLLSSGDTFNLADLYFFYDEEGGRFVSFSTKQEFIEAVEEDVFINEIMNRN